MKQILAWLIILLGSALLLGVVRPAAAQECYVVDTYPLCVPDEPEGRFSVPEPRNSSFLEGAIYGWVEDYAYFYHEPGPGTRHARTAGTGFFYGPAVETHKDENGKNWYKVWDYWLPEQYYHIVEASSFAGVEVHEQPIRPFGWVLRPSAPRPEPSVEPPAGTPELQRYDFVEVYDTAYAGGTVWFNVGKERASWVRFDRVALIDVRERPNGVAANEFWVDVDLTHQTFTAYEGDRVVYAGLVSSGLSRWPTRVGLNRVWARHETTPMSGGVVGDDFYYIDDVPHTMYFDGETALHGAFWHDDFGRPKSHGCVNMAPRTAEWVYHWSANAPGGLWVHVHHSNYNEFID